MNEELKVVISAEIGDLKKNVAEAQKSIKGMSDGVIKDMGKFKDGFIKAGDACKKGLATAAKAIGAVGGALLALGPATKEFRESQAKLNTAFEAAGGSAETAKETYNDLYRVMGESDTAVEAANHLAKLTTNEKDLSEWTKICEGVYATFGDSLPIESLTEAINETAKTGQVTGSLADALNWAGMEGQTFGVQLKEQIEFTKLSKKELEGLTDSERADYEAKKAQYEAIEKYNKGVTEAASAEDFFNIALAACNTEAEREKLIRETLNGTYSDAAAKYEENAKAILEQNEANAHMQESLAKIGEAVTPIQTALTELGATILEQLTPYIQEFAETYMPKIKEALSGVGDAIGKVISFIAEHWQLIATIGGVIAGIAATISVLSTALTVYNTVMGIAAVVNAAAIAPILAIVAAIGAVIAIIVVCVKHWDQIKEVTAKVCEKIKEVVGNMVEKVKEFFGNMKDKVVETVNNFKEAVSEKFNAMKDAVSNKVTEIKDKVSTKFNEIKTAVTEKTQAAKEAVAEKYNAMKAAISEKVEAAKSAVSEKFNTIKTVVSEKANAAKEAALEKFAAMRDGMAERMSAAKEKVSGVLDNIKSAFSDKLNAAKDAVKGIIDKIKGLFNFEWHLPKLKLPHFSIKGKFSLDPPSVPHLSVDWYAKGGVFDKPTLFPYGNGQIGGLGENGAEAVVPLEKNTEWLDKIADRLGGGGSVGPIVLEVDGRTFGQIAVRSINDLTKQQGRLALQLA